MQGYCICCVKRWNRFASVERHARGTGRKVELLNGLARVRYSSSFRCLVQGGRPSVSKATERLARERREVRSALPMPMPTPITVHSRCRYIDNAHRLIILCPKCPPHCRLRGALLMPPSARVTLAGSRNNKHAHLLAPALKSQLWLRQSSLSWWIGTCGFSFAVLRPHTGIEPQHLLWPQSFAPLPCQ